MRYMRKLFLLIVALVTSFCYSQTDVINDSITFRSDNDNTLRTILLKTPGDELIIAQNHYYTGLAINAIGAATIMLGTRQQKESISTSFYIVGGLIALTGTIIQIESHIHIRRAGVLLNYYGTGASIKLRDYYKYKSVEEMSLW